MPAGEARHTSQKHHVKVGRALSRSRDAFMNRWGAIFSKRDDINYLQEGARLDGDCARLPDVRGAFTKL